MPHTVRTYDNNIPAVCRTLRDVVMIDWTKNAMGGPVSAVVKLNRKVGQTYIDVAFGYYVEVVWEDGDVVWQGTLNTMPETLSDTGTFDIGLVGDLFLLSALQGTWNPNYPNPTELRTIITDGITASAPGISFSTTSFPNTGTSVIYTPDNVSSVKNHLDELIKYGDSNTKSLFWQVINRVFYVFKRPYPLTVYDYKVDIMSCAQVDLGNNGDTFYTRTSVRWKDANNVHISPYNNTAMQTKYGMSFGTNNPSGTRLAYIREPTIIDITGHGALTQAQADNVGNTLLNRYSSDGVRVTASKITVTDGAAVRDFNSSQIINLSKILPAKVLMLANIPGSNGAIGPTSSAMFIGQVHYTETYGSMNQVAAQVDISAEDVVDPSNVLAALIAQLPKEHA